jgi:hypothetical protein
MFDITLASSQGGKDMRCVSLYFDLAQKKQVGCSVSKGNAARKTGIYIPPPHPHRAVVSKYGIESVRIFISVVLSGV